MSSVLQNPEETHIFAILYPAPGKLQRVSSLPEIDELYLG